jgi:cyclic pyranopterin phosphate synthase
MSDELVDQEKRHLNYLRISITDRCNLRCLYCAPEGRIPKLATCDILSYEEILRLVKIGIGSVSARCASPAASPWSEKGRLICWVTDPHQGTGRCLIDHQRGSSCP